MKSLIALAAAASAATITGIVTASADAPFACTDRSGGINGVPGQITSVRAAHHDGYDRLVFEFAPFAAGAIPTYRLTQQASSTFHKDPSDLPVTLEGSAGIKAVFQNTTVAAGVPSDLKAELPVIREAAKLGDFERVSSYGIGLSHAACFRLQELGGPRLVIDVVVPQAASPAGSNQSTAAASPGSQPAGPKVLASTGQQADLTVTSQPTATGSSELPLVLGLAAIAAAALVIVGGQLATKR